MGKLEAKLPEMYRELHAKGAFKGDTWRQVQEAFAEFVTDHVTDSFTRKLHVLDYGCGPEGGLCQSGSWRPELTCRHNVTPFDPYVEAYSALPWDTPYNLFFSCDVFEHLPLSELHYILDRLRGRKALLAVFLSITTRPANKTLPNGLNAHLLVHPPEWWHGVLVGGLGSAYNLCLSHSDLLNGEVQFGFVRATARKEPPPGT